MKKSLSTIGLLSLLISVPALAETKFDPYITEADKLLRHYCALSVGEVRAESDAKVAEFEREARWVSSSLPRDVFAKISESNAQILKARQKLREHNERYYAAKTEEERKQRFEDTRVVGREWAKARFNRDDLYQAIKASPEWSKVTWAMTEKNLNLTLEIRDDDQIVMILWGPGTSAKVLEKAEDIHALPIPTSNLMNEISQACRHYRDLEQSVGQIEAPVDLSVNNQPVKMLETPVAPQPKPVSGSIPAEESGGGKL